MKIETLTVIGLGLMGGSVAMAARKRALANRVIGVDRQREALNFSIQTGIIDEGFLEPSEAIEASDLVVVCTPVDQIAADVVTAASLCQPGTLLTDVGSTKLGIIKAVENALPADTLFVGGHPLAGSEKSGATNSRPDLFEGRLVILVSTAKTTSAALDRITEFWVSLGANVEVMEPEAHDRAVAWTSHLPHMVASALSAVLPRGLEAMCATGFRDTTRIASGDPLTWSPILLENRKPILDSLSQLDECLSSIRQALMRADRRSLDALLTQGKEVRDALGD
jgi:prephenate dehydrogenase